jgi:plasmid stabilization system protein ParE
MYLPAFGSVLNFSSHHVSRVNVSVFASGRSRRAGYRRKHATHLGKDQTALYLNELEACCKRLADTPALGRPCDEIQPGLHRLEHGKHVVFYRQEREGILVSRILHQICSQRDIRSRTRMMIVSKLATHRFFPGMVWWGVFVLS